MNFFQQCMRQVYVSARKVDKIKKSPVQEIKMSQLAWQCEFLPTMHETSVCICEEGRQCKKVSVQEIKMSQSAWHCEFFPTMHKTSVCICICEESRQYKKSLSTGKLRCRNQRGIVKSFQQCIRQVYVSARKVDKIKKSLYRKLRCRNQRGIVNSFQQCMRQVYVSARKVDNIKSLCKGN